MARMPARHVVEPGDGPEQRARGAAGRRDVPARLIFEVFEELGRRLVLAGVLAPALRVAPALRIPVVTAGFGGRGGGAGVALLRDRRRLPLRLQPVLRRAHLVGAGPAPGSRSPPAEGLRRR